jgi:hypothetical protein
MRSDLAIVELLHEHKKVLEFLKIEIWYISFEADEGSIQFYDRVNEKAVSFRQDDLDTQGNEYMDSIRGFLGKSRVKYEVLSKLPTEDLRRLGY